VAGRGRQRWIGEEKRKRGNEEVEKKRNQKNKI
jgi:hypothetical protein